MRPSARRNASYAPLGRQPFHLRQRQPRAGIFGGGVEPVDANMGDAEVRLGVDRQRENPVEFGRRVIGGARALIALVRLIGRRRGDDGDAGAAEGLLQGREGDIDELRPAIGLREAQRLIIGAGALHIRDIGVMGRGEAHLAVERIGQGVVGEGAHRCVVSKGVW
jgi:hypothetical protein